MLPEILDQVSDEHLTVAVDAYAAVFFSDEQRAQLREIIVASGTRITWIDTETAVG